MTTRLPPHHNINFECLDATASWPSGEFDLISFIDVIHHIPPNEQRRVFAQASARVARGKWLLYKDMSERPLWRATANRLHDLVVARQWIHYAALDNVLKWGSENGLIVKNKYNINMIWYHHELVSFQRS
jgi:hypothetical protein